MKRMIDLQMVESVLLEGANSFAEETGSHEKDEVGHDDQENGESCKMKCEILRVTGIKCDTCWSDWQRSKSRNRS